MYWIGESMSLMRMSRMRSDRFVYWTRGTVRGKTILLVKVIWLHHGLKEATWGRESEVRAKYPDLFSSVGTFI